MPAASQELFVTPHVWGFHSGIWGFPRFAGGGGGGTFTGAEVAAAAAGGGFGGSRDAGGVGGNGVVHAAFSYHDEEERGRFDSRSSDFHSEECVQVPECLHSEECDPECDPLARLVRSCM